MAKVRVHELAKDLGVESKVVLATLKDMGEFVKSASSTVEAPVIHRLMTQHGEALRSHAGKRRAPPVVAQQAEPANVDTFTLALRAQARAAESLERAGELAFSKPASRRRAPTKRRRWKGPIPWHVQAFLPATPPDGGYWAADVEEAKRRSHPWLMKLYEPADIAKWQRICPGLSPEQADALRRLMVPVELLDQPFMHGKVATEGQTLGRRLGRGELSVSQVHSELKFAGLL